MSLPSSSASISNFQAIFNAALKAYEKKTKKDLLAHPLAAQLQACNSPSDILAVLQDKVNEFDQSRSADERLSKWLNPTINVLYSFSATIGQVFSPASVIFSGIGVLLLVAKDVKPAEILSSISSSVSRTLQAPRVIYRNTANNRDDRHYRQDHDRSADIFAIATKEMRRVERKLIGKKEMEDALKRLDKLTQEEARMAAAETLKLTHLS
ncbi:hypothetical protein EI94DRAFT_1822061 [Lactarius quietus]|nr:hypothetical protein EI94DRAFT_1822061 [Lactarius quietus]